MTDRTPEECARQRAEIRQPEGGARIPLKGDNVRDLHSGNVGRVVGHAWIGAGFAVKVQWKYWEGTDKFSSLLLREVEIVP